MANPWLYASGYRGPSNEDEVKLLNQELDQLGGELVDEGGTMLEWDAITAARKSLAAEKSRGIPPERHWVRASDDPYGPPNEVPSGYWPNGDVIGSEYIPPRVDIYAGQEAQMMPIPIPRSSTLPRPRRRARRR